jgi:hypothetical protein
MLDESCPNVAYKSTVDTTMSGCHPSEKVFDSKEGGAG